MIERFAMGIGAIVLASLVMPRDARSATLPTLAGQAVPHYGAMFPALDAQQRPDAKLRYRVVFGVTQAAPSAEAPNPSLVRVARYVNLLAYYGVRIRPGDLVAIVSGPATIAVTRTQAYSNRTKSAANPNIPMIEELQMAGVTVAVCSQALHGSGLSSADGVPGVRIDASAMITATTLQLKGYAYLPD